MKTTIKEEANKYLVTLEGEMDTAAAMEAEEKLQQLYTAGNRDVVIECQQLEYIASSGLRILLKILKTVKANGCNVVLRNVNDDIKEVFRLTGFIDIFAFE